MTAQQSVPLYPVVVDEARIARVNLGTAAADEAREIELVLNSLPEGERDMARSYFKSGFPTGANNPETAGHLATIAAIRLARARHDAATASVERAVPTIRVRLALVEHLPSSGARAVVLRRASDDVDATILVPVSGATGADIDLAVRALRRTVTHAKPHGPQASKIVIRSATGADPRGASYWSDVLETVGRRPDSDVPGLGKAKFILVNIATD